jgi:malto-oligosyltrehalose synthase/4-alpha-glucanotransferase
MYNPVSTYRIQFNKNYGFKDFQQDMEYFILLGTSAIYASPVFAAEPGSMHGYDVADPHMINPEIGTYDEFKAVTTRLKAAGVGWLQDIVPNHMVFSMNNQWLMDVLEKGPESKYAGFFDIDFNHPDFSGRIMIPFLGKEPEEAVADREIQAAWLNGGPVIRYFDYYFPLSIESYKLFAGHSSINYPGFSVLMENVDPGNFSADDWSHFKTNLQKLNNEPEFRKYIDEVLARINSDNISLMNLLDIQHYKLSYWRDSADKINYRRFFTVNSLICLNIENDTVFDEYHRFIKREVEENRIEGLRIDHIDGLKAPLSYMDRLRSLAGEEAYIVAEKILGRHELLPFDIPIQGTSGYDFLGIVNNLLTYKPDYHELEKFYGKITGIKADLRDIIYNKKKLILTKGMAGEWENLARMLDESGLVNYDEEVSRNSMKEAIGEFLVLFPVYKLYSDGFPLTWEESKIVMSVFARGVEKAPSLERSFLALGNIFLYQEGFSGSQKEKAFSFFLRCMQFTGPLMAKGVEDTTMYYYNCFIGHNEVGDEPGASGIAISDFHRLMEQRQRNWPLTMNTTSTHDTKRGEDVRARLNVITELVDEWKRSVKDWMRLNQDFRTRRQDNRYSPDENEEYFIYQTLTGVFPFDGIVTEDFLVRLDEYLVKSMREAKANTDWNDQDEEHEKSVIAFTRKILAPGSRFLEDFLPFQMKVANFGIINSLTQLMLKATCPGIPDFYQGSELWDLSMVDPDNRRPVDYEQRYRLLKMLEDQLEDNQESLFPDFYLSRKDGRIKLMLTHQLLVERKNDPDLFAYGRYIPLKVKGKYKDHIIAYARVYKNSWFIVIAPLYLAVLPDNRERDEPANIDWGDTTVIIPEMAPLVWSTSFGQKEFKPQKNISVADIMKVPCPVFIKGKRAVVSRAAGVLAHISSLPGKYGIGDLGAEAFDFADLLEESGQRYWQILPFNPVGEGYAFSPYSSISAFAGNTMFVSPDLLVRSRLISTDSANQCKFRESDRTIFNRASDLRNIIIKEAAETFFSKTKMHELKLFNDFCEKQRYWLDDFSLFSIIKKEYKGIPWNKWPEELKNRDESALAAIAAKYAIQLRSEKFGQYLFQKQWRELKNHCNHNSIRIIGDLSFYVNYDSAEVWANPGLFKLDAKKNPLYVAGVPPDFFSETGQLWNMPVFNWEKMRKTGYEWWMNRIKRNMELCDVIRFDHFRGFSEYWEVPAGSVDSINGKWAQGPGKKFFDLVKKAFPAMPFIAEDLGYIDEKVYRLRDEFLLPGMVILQFAFGENTPGSAYIPHNYIHNSIVYTGTHDNNTTRGWFTDELDDKTRKEAEEYIGHNLDNDSCHEDFIRLAYSSVAKLAVIPVQDILGLDSSARLNKPSTSEKNWSWKMKKGDLSNEFFAKLRRMAVLYGRI